MDKEDLVYTHTQTHTMEYYKAVTKNEIMPSAQHGWTYGYHTMDTNELIYKTEVGSQT